MNAPTRLFVATYTWLVLLASGCAEDDDANASDAGSDRPDNTGAACEAPADCYPGVDASTLEGDVLCLDRVRGGYCTHTCDGDENCCAVEGECVSGFPQVCSPFESTDEQMCFLSCEADDVDADPNNPEDDQEYCQRHANRDFICRSSGGGSQNRKVCVPGDCGVGAACLSDADCTGDLRCLTGLRGGYCSRENCSADADCPNGSRCVESEGKNYCFRSCERASDCSFCRGFDVEARCEDAALPAGGTALVCVP